MSHKPAQKRCWECAVYKEAEARRQNVWHGPGVTPAPIFCEKLGCYINAMSFCREGEWEP